MISFDTDITVCGYLFRREICEVKLHDGTLCVVSHQKQWDSMTSFIGLSVGVSWVVRKGIPGLKIVLKTYVIVIFLKI